MSARLTIFFAAALALSAQGLSNRRAPSFSLPDSALQQHDILDYRGSWLLLHMMETNCPACKDVSRKLEGVKTKYGSKVAVLSIAITPPDTQATVAKYIAETKIASTIVFDSGQVIISYFKATPQNPIFDRPHVFAIDPNGMIVKDWVQQAMAAPGFVAELDRLIAGPPSKK